jgi:uncharacterized membrane-anchored protein
MRRTVAHVVVPAGAEPRDAVGDRVAGREEQDRRLEAAGAQRLTQVAAIRVRQADVDDREVERRLGTADRRRRIADDDDLESLLPQAARQQAPQLQIVLDDEHSGSHGPQDDVRPSRRGAWSGEVQARAASLAGMTATALPAAGPSSLRQMLNKVPEVTLCFWIIKIMATTVGETAADYLNTTLGFGLTKTTYVMGALLLVALGFQCKTRKYVPPVYWLVVVFISVVGTLITDNLTDSAGVPLETSTAAFAIALALTFAGWYISERTLSIHTIHTTRREAWYWLAILFTFALGTAAGDLAAERLNLGYALSGAIFGGLIALITFAHLRLRLNAVLAFWLAYILTRPLGASIGDGLSQSQHDGGLGLGTTGTTVLFLTTILSLVAFLTVTRRDATEAQPA